MSRFLHDVISEIVAWRPPPRADDDAEIVGVVLVVAGVKMLLAR